MIGLEQGDVVVIADRGTRLRDSPTVDRHPAREHERPRAFAGRGQAAVDEHGIQTSAVLQLVREITQRAIAGS
jgi:hypothetical protein